MKVRCDACGEEFEATNTMQEARAEAAAVFTTWPPEEEANICDDCWGPFMEWMRSHHPEAVR